MKLIAIFYPKKEALESFIKEATSLVPKSRQDNGCISYALHAEEGGERVLFIEEWESKDALDSHIQKHSTHIERLKELSLREELIFIRELA